MRAYSYKVRAYEGKRGIVVVTTMQQFRATAYQGRGCIVFRESEVILNTNFERNTAEFRILLSSQHIPVSFYSYGDLTIAVLLSVYSYCTRKLQLHCVAETGLQCKPTVH